MFAALRRALAPVVLGASGWIAVVLLVGCAQESGPVTASKSKYKAADSAEATSAGKDEGAAETRTAADDEPAPKPPGIDVSNVPPVDEANPRAGAKGAKNLTTSAATLEVPDTDNPKVLWDFMEELKNRQPRGSSRTEQLEDFQRIQAARMAAGEKILVSTNDEQMKLDALQAMQEIFMMYMQLGVTDAAPKLKMFADQMAKRDDPTLAQYGKLLQFQLRFSELVSRPTTTPDDIVQEVKSMLEQYKDASAAEQQNALMLAVSVTEMLEQQGLREEAVQVQRLIAQEIRNNKDPLIAEQAGMMEARANVTEANLTSLAENVLLNEEGAIDDLMAAVKKLLSDVEHPSIAYVSPLQEVGQLLEYSGNVEPAREVFSLLAEKYKNHENKKVSEIVGEMTDNALARLDLVGKPFQVEGLTQNGEPFDWESYRGKVVLVDFWATWCGPCLQEIPNILENFETFKDKGFAVVGVNLNTDMQEVKEFETVQRLPWPSVFSKQQLDGDQIESWSDIPMAKKYGVDAIPFIVLVGKDGTVDSLHVRGPKLAARLGKLLGEGAKPEADAPKTEEAGEEEKTSQAKPRAPEAGLPPAVGGLFPRGLGAVLSGAVFFQAAEGDEVADQPAAKPAVAENQAEALGDTNPYSAKPGLSAKQLEAWLEKALDKPKTIQSRPGFSEAVAEACDRLMKFDPPPSDSALLLAVETKLHILHQAACNGDEKADEQLQATVKQFAEDKRPKVAKLIAFYQAERKALDGEEAALETVPATLAELKEFFAKEKLAAKHLRMASATVAIINRIEDGDEREKHFEEFGKTFATSSDKELARYGRKLAKKPAVKQSDLVGKELELDGVTSDGLPLVWNTYRGKVVVVDFWATWCGPCRKELPNVIATYEKHKDRGFEILGISLDKDMEALATFLEQNPLPWATLAGETTEDLATRYGVRGIPTLLLVDQEGKVAAVAHRIEQLEPQIEKLLAGGAGK